MGTYTTNYNLFMPSIGEQGWGELVNGNFVTIDSAMDGLNTRVGTLETETDAIEERVTTLEAGNFETVNAGSVIADNFVGGTISGQFTPPTLSYSGYTNYNTYNANYGTMTIPIYSHYTPISGVVSVKVDSHLNGKLTIIGVNAVTIHTLTSTQTEYTVTDAYSVSISFYGTNHYSATIGNPVFIYHT